MANPPKLVTVTVTMAPAKISFIVTTAVITVLIFTIVASLIHIGLNKPRPPTFRLEAVTVSYFSTTTRVELTALINVVFTIKNPNHKLTLSFESLNAAIWFDRRNLALASFEPFSLGTGTDITVRAWFVVFHKMFNGSTLVRRIAVQQASGSVELGLTMHARFRFLSGSVLHSTVREMTIECYPMDVVFPQNDNSGASTTPLECDAF